MAKENKKKKRASEYEKKLKIEGSLDQVLKVSTETKKHGDKEKEDKKK